MPDPIAASNIAAQAFRAMELAPIASFGDDSPQARDAKEQYPVALDTLLRTADWSFASTVADLTPPTTLPPGVQTDANLPTLFILPTDCVIVRHVEADAWRIDDIYLRTEALDAVSIRYTRRIENETRLPRDFQTAVSLRLAVLLAPRWVQSRTKRADLRAEAYEVQKDAERSDAPLASPQSYDGRERDLPAAVDWVSEVTR